MKDRFYQKDEVLGEGEMEDEAEEGEGIQALEKMAWLRWLFFLLGTLGPAIKMCAMRGIPWTQGWSMMFLASFLVFEGLSIMNWATRSKSSPSNMAPGARTLHEQVTFAYSDLPPRFRKIEKWLAGIGIFLHCSILLWAVMDIWTLRIPSSKVKEILPDSLMLSVAIIWLAYAGILLAWTFILVVGWAMLALILKALEWFSAARNGSSIPQFFTLLDALLVIAVMATGIGVIVWVLFDQHLLIDMLLSLVTFGAIPAFIYGVEIVCKWSPKVGATLLVREGENGDTDRYVVYCLAFFLVNITVSVLWYSLRYDSDGTVNPGWTGIFG
jgi:hypothetical protein